MQGDAETMRALIERVEQASGPDRELDAEIAEATGMTLSKDRTAVYAGYRVNANTDEQYDAWDDVPFFSESLDAAVTLVPEGQPWQVCQLTEPPSGSARRPVEFSAQVRHAGGENRWTLTHAATPALAFCAAALRARAMEARDAT